MIIIAELLFSFFDDKNDKLLVRSIKNTVRHYEMAGSQKKSETNPMKTSESIAKSPHVWYQNGGHLCLYRSHSKESDSGAITPPGNWFSEAVRFKRLQALYEQEAQALTSAL